MVELTGETGPRFATGYNCVGVLYSREKNGRRYIHNSLGVVAPGDKRDVEKRVAAVKGAP